MRFPTASVPRVLLVLVAATLLTPGVYSWSLAEEPIRRTPGPQADGSVVLPNQWSLRPTGKQVEVGDFPVNIAIHPDGRHAVILHCGFGPHELAVIDLETRKVLSRTRIDEAFQTERWGEDSEAALKAQEHRNTVFAALAAALHEVRAAAGYLYADDAKRLHPYRSQYEATRKRNRRKQQ